MTKFATITTTSGLLALTSEIIKLGKGRRVLLVPYHYKVLAELLEIIPDKKAGKKKFTQARLAECVTELAKARGYDKKYYLSQKTVSSYCRGEFVPDAIGLDLMGDVLGVFLVPGLDRQVDTRQILDYIKKLHQE